MAVDSGKNGLRQRKGQLKESEELRGDTTPGPSEAQIEPSNVPEAALSIDLRLILVAFVSFSVRIWRINYPDQVVWDEVHFAGFAGHYLTVR